jgi:hypothetical protein
MSRARNDDLPNSAWAATVKMINSAAIPPAVRAKNFLSRSSSIGTNAQKPMAFPVRHQGISAPFFPHSMRANSARYLKTHLVRPEVGGRKKPQAFVRCGSTGDLKIDWL